MGKKAEHKIMYCNKCGKKTLHYRQVSDTNSLANLLLTIFTGGLWLIVWLFSGFKSHTSKQLTSWTCSQCGNKRG